MPLSGTFDTIQLCDLLQWIHASRKSGTLNVSADLDDTYLVFREGSLVALGSYDPLRLDLGQVLLARGIIDEDQLAAVQKQAGQGTPLLTALTAAGAVDAATVASVQNDHAFETVLDLFLVEEGNFRFSPGETPHGFLPPPDIPETSYLKRPIPLQEVLYEGMRRLDDWNRMLTFFPNSYVLVHGLEGESQNLVWLELRRAGEPISVGELCLRMGGSRFSVYRQLHEAYGQRLIGVDQMSPGDTPPVPQVPADMLLENARLLMAERQYQEARAVLATAANLAPDNHESRRLLQEVREAQIAHLYEQIPPHRVPVLAVEPERITTLGLSPREAFLASRLHGRWDVATLVLATPLGELTILQALHKLLHAGIAKLEM